MMETILDIGLNDHSVEGLTAHTGGPRFAWDSYRRLIPGVAFTRDPATGARGVYGDYLTNAQGEDVVAGVRNTVPLEKIETIDPACYHQLLSIMDTLEKHYRELCDIEFTIERGRLWMLQTRVGKRTPAAAFTSQLVDEGLIDLDEALARVTGEQVTQLMFPTFDDALPEPLTRGVPASPGAAVGRVVLDSAEAAVASGSVILVRRETSPDDLAGMIAAQEILTSRGGKTSHAAVVARGMGKTCVCGAEDVQIAPDGRSFTVGGVTVNAGDSISIDGSTGAAYLGDLPVHQSPAVRYFDGALDARTDPLIHAIDSLGPVLRAAGARLRQRSTYRVPVARLNAGRAAVVSFTVWLALTAVGR